MITKLGVRKLLPGCLAMAVVLAGCSKSTLDYRNVQIVDGKIYPSNIYLDGNSNQAFSGTVTNFPVNQLLAGNQQGMVKFLDAVARGMQTSNTQDAQFVRSQGPAATARLLLAAPSAMCAVSVHAGLLDGDADCTVPESQTPSSQMAFDKGTLDGDITYFDSKGNKLADGEFKDGIPVGKENVYSAETGKVVLKINWENGGWNGDIQGFDPNSGALTYEVKYVDGKSEGVATTYSPDGKHKIETETFVHGVSNGPLDTYDPVTGAYTSHGMEVNGKLEGQAEVWNAQGQLLRTYTYKDGNDVTSVSIQQVDCSAASASSRTQVETLVCGNAGLRKDDALLTTTYRRAAKTGANANSLEDGQRNWVVQMRDKCTTVACLESAYKERMDALAGSSPPSLHATVCTADSERYTDVRTICSTPALLADDQAMIAAYKTAYAATLADGKQAIQEGISYWVDYVRQPCREDVQCLDSAFRNLTAKLNAIAHDPDLPASAYHLDSNTPAPNSVTAGSAPNNAVAQPGNVQPMMAKQQSPGIADSGSSIHASFDCAKAMSSVEKMICSNQMLATYDVRMMQSYKAAMASRSDKSAVRNAQRTWMAQRNACTTLDCVSRAYQERISQLNSSR